MSTTRALWTRVLRIGLDGAVPALDGGADGGAVQARSRFRSQAAPERVAVYSVREVAGRPPRIGEHTLAVVREFRRVPLEATTLGLVLFTARAGRAAGVVATLAHYAERAVSAYQPVYVLVARALEAPPLSILIAGVREGVALEAAGPAAFSLDGVLSDLDDQLAAPPEWFAYCREPTPRHRGSRLITPSPV